MSGLSSPASSVGSATSIGSGLSEGEPQSEEPSTPVPFHIKLARAATWAMFMGEVSYELRDEQTRGMQ